MNATLTTLSTMPVLVTGYALLMMSALVGAAILAWDGTQLFLRSDSSPRVVHQRQYVTTVAEALTWLVGGLVVILVIAVALAVATTVTVGML
jgi:hypothetical protein